MPATALDLTSDSTLTPTPPRVRKTRVLIVSDHPTKSRDVATRLRALELDVQLCLFDGNTLTAIPNQAPDAVLCHLIDYAEHGPKLAKVIRAHFKSPSIPLIGAMSRPFPDASLGFDSTLFEPMHASQIANRVNSMIRLGIMEGEIKRRLRTLEEDFDQTPSISDISPDRKFRVLFIGKASPSFMIIINALQDKGVDVIAAFTSFSAFDYLHGDPFDAVVMNALEQSEPALSISEAMRRNSKLFHTPTLFLVDGDKFKDQKAAYECGARDIISIDAQSDEISGRILELANYHRIHEQMKSDFINLAKDVARDPSKTAYSEEFMRAHLPRILNDAAKSNLPTTLIGLRIQPKSNIHVTPEALKSAYRQTTDLITSLVRMQDVVCRWTEDTFVLAFYDTNEAEAQRILQRINALLDCTIYESGTPMADALSLSANASISAIPASIGNSNDHLNTLVANLERNPDEV